jgi:serine/threonine protein kinase
MFKLGDLVQKQYRIVRYLGRGGFGRVWLAHDQVAEREVAIKELIDPSESAVDDMLREVRTIAQFNLPGVVRFYHAIPQPAEGTCLLVMEFCPNGTLADRLAQAGYLTEQEATDYPGEVAATLHEVHERGFVHRDLKPGNLLFDAEGNLKISDFGLANQRDGRLYW